MRKADYAALAEIIKTAREIAQSDYARTPEISRAKFVQCGVIAELFATRASVDRAEFLKACGITP